MEFEAIGTHWWIQPGKVDLDAPKIKQTIDKIDKTWSRFRDDSMVARMARTAGRYDLPEPDIELLNWYRQLYEATDGLMTPLIGQTLSDAGYDKDYSLRPKATIQATPTWDEVMSLGKTSLTIKQPWLIDVGAAGKGYVVDKVAELLSGDFCVDAGGDIKVGDIKMDIGLEDPRDPTKLIGVATVKDAAICGSAVNRRAWKDWHHVVNPKTSRPVDNIIATWVICDSAMRADGLATALFFVTPDKLQHLADFKYCIMYSDGSIKVTNDETIKIFTENK
jgi:thiamine biosynthesis lipoprotein